MPGSNSSHNGDHLSTIALNRQFFEWREGELSDPGLFRRFRRTADLLTGRQFRGGDGW